MQHGVRFHLYTKAKQTVCCRLEDSSGILRGKLTKRFQLAPRAEDGGRLWGWGQTVGVGAGCGGRGRLWGWGQAVRGVRIQAQWV